MKKNLLVAVALGAALTASAQRQWVKQTVGIPVSGTKFANDIKVVDANNVWAWFRSSSTTTNLRQYSYTKNGGATWTAKTLSATPAVTNLEIANMSVLDSATAYASLYPPSNPANQGIYRTVNGGTSWKKVTTGKFTAGSSFVNWVHFWDKAKGVCMGDPANGSFEIYTTADSGTTWTRVDSAMSNAIKPIASGEYGIVNLFDARPNGKLWFGTNRGRILTTKDFGVTWTGAQSGFVETDSTKQAFSTIRFKNDSVGVIVATKTVTTGTTTSVDSVMVTATTDGGATFMPWSYSGQWNPGDVCFVPNTNTMVTVNSLNLSNKFIYPVGSTISTDGGMSFGYQDSVTALTAVAFANDSIGYAGGIVAAALNAGVYKWDYAPLVKLASALAATTEVALYPNPASNVLNIVVPSKKAQVVIYNMIGEQVATTTVNDGRLVVDIANYNSGAYVVQIIDGKSKFTKKFIKE